MAETFGSGISTKITDQLKARTKLFSDRKDPKQLQVINSNSAWIKVRSSVNIAGDNSKAKQFILSNSGNKEGIGDTNTSLYKADNRLGFRPAPGITGFKVTSKNTYGTLQEATVNFNVWTLKDLEDAEKLFFRPGYSVLVEWGHSAYITSDGTSNIKFTNREAVLDDNKWFQSSTYGAIEKLIAKKRDNYYGNYEGFLGLIVNFSWSYRSDGGYDCSIKVVSKNVVLESIAIGKGTDLVKSEENANKKVGQLDSKIRKSPFHVYYLGLEGFYRIENEGKTGVQALGGGILVDSGEGEKIVTDALYYNLKAALGQKYKDSVKFYINTTDFTVFRLKISKSNESHLDYSKNNVIHYVPLSSVLEIYNNHICIKDKNNKEVLIPFDLESEEKFFTFGGHYSALPHEVLMRTIPSVPKNSILPPPFDYEGFRVFNFQPNNTFDTNPLLINNIYVSTRVILEEVDKVIESNSEGVGVLEAIEGILSRIERAYGGVNEFDIVNADDNSSMKIVDRKNLDPTKAKSLSTRLDVTGLGSTVVDLSVSSGITSDIASQIAVAAQAPSNSTDDNVANLLRWNKNLTDRHLEKKNTTDDSLSDPEPEASEAFKLNQLWKAVNEKNKDSSSNSWTFEEWENLYQQTSSHIQELAQLPYIVGDEFEEAVPGVVPVELSLKMLGLGGFKVGTTFKLQKGILPAKYDEFGYIITGVEHEIASDNKWYTNINTQFFVLKK
jgi:hypothetical protein